jgi:tetratricopeptide (TPR) repeat protein
MTKNCSIVLLLVLIAAPLPSQTPESLFRQGNALYQQGKFAEARESYEQILKSGYVSGEVFFNLGNAYYKTGDIAKAILHYERARRLMPGDDDLLHNLQLANLQIADRIEPAPRLFIWDFWESVRRSISVESATWLTYGWYLLLLSCVALFILSHKYARRKAALLVGSVSLVGLLISATVLTGKIDEVHSADDAVIMVDITTAKNSPDAQSSDAFVLHAGVKVTITDRVNDWLKVRLADGKVGWLQEAAVDTI